MGIQGPRLLPFGGSIIPQGFRVPEAASARQWDKAECGGSPQKFLGARPGIRAPHLPSHSVYREFNHTADPRGREAGLHRPVWPCVGMYRSAKGGHWNALLHMGKPRSRTLRNLPRVTEPGLKPVVGLQGEGSLSHNHDDVPERLARHTAGHQVREDEQQQQSSNDSHAPERSHFPAALPLLLSPNVESGAPGTGQGASSPAPSLSSGPRTEGESVCSSPEVSPVGEGLTGRRRGAGGPKPSTVVPPATSSCCPCGHVQNNPECHLLVGSVAGPGQRKGPETASTFSSAPHRWRDLQSVDGALGAK